MSARTATLLDDLRGLVRRCGVLRMEPRLSTADLARIIVALGANDRVGHWLSAALDDPAVCDEMKADIRAWMEATQ